MKLSRLQKLNLIYQISLGLKALHEKNIVHLDLKLKNILVNENLDKCVVTDFGISKVIADGKTQNTNILGVTARYSPLEQYL